MILMRSHTLKVWLTPSRIGSKEPNRDHQAASELAKPPLDRHLAGIQLRLVEPADLVGNRQHRGSTRKHFIAQKCISRPLPLFRRPLERGFQNAPVSSQLLGEHLERLRLARAQELQVGKEAPAKG